MARSAPLDDEVEIILARLRPAEADIVRQAIGIRPWERRQIMLDQRDQLIRGLALRFHAGSSDNAAAGCIAADLARMGPSGSTLVSSPDPERSALARIVQLSNGTVLGPVQVRRILGGARSSAS